MRSCVEIENLTKRYGRLAALDACTLDVVQGEVFGLLGPNGAGKTTLLRVLLGFLRPSAGSATIDGFDCYRQSVSVRGRVSYLPGEVRLPRGWRGRDVLQFFSEIRRDDSFDRALRMAERLELALDKPVSAMSTGTRQKLALVGALAPFTPVVILDEPTSALDPTVRAEVLGLVREAREAGRTVIFSSHVMSEVEEVCDRVAILRSGQLVHLQDMLQLRRQHRIRARLVGPLVPAPAELQQQLAVAVGDDGAVSITTPGELSPLLAWLATLPLAEVQIEPVGLRAVYDRFHPGLRGN